MATSNCPGCKQSISVTFDAEGPRIECGGEGEGSCIYCWALVVSPELRTSITAAQDASVRVEIERIVGDARAWEKRLAEIAKTRRPTEEESAQALQAYELAAAVSEEPEGSECCGASAMIDNDDRTVCTICGSEVV